MASTVDGDIHIRTNGDISRSDLQSKPPTTTISTIAVQSGNTRIVIALLQSKEWIQLKIQEMHPSMTDIGQNLEEAAELHQQHEKVLEKLQTKQSPVEELLRQADELIASQKPRGEVYSAMAENLGLAWKDLNAQLEQRRQILEQAVAFFTRSKDFADTLDRIQKNLSDSYLPDDTSVCATMVQRHQEDRKAALSCSMHMLKEGQHLLEKLCEVATHSMGDSRPFHMQHAARKTSTFVETYMEALHDRWRHLEALWTQRKLKLDQCLRRCQFLAELSEVQKWLAVKGVEYMRQQNLGDSLATAEILQHEHSKIEKDTKAMQDKSLKLVKSAEQLAYSGNYAGEELKVKAYEVLSECSELLNVLESRRLLLSSAVAFFNSAQTTLNKLDQIEIQLTTSEGVSTAAQQANLNATIEEIASPAIHEGRALIDKVGCHEPGVQGVASKVGELERRRVHLLDLCNARQTASEEQIAAFRNFNNNYQVLISWITNNGMGFIGRNGDMGTTQTSAKNFVDQHETLQNDLRFKGIEVEALLSIVPSLVCVGGTDAQDVLRKSENLREQWNMLRTLLDKRLSIGQCYLSFHKLAAKVLKEISDLEWDVSKVSEVSSNTTVRAIEEKFLTLQQGILQLKNSGKNFLEDTQKMENLYINMAEPRAVVQSILDDIESRKTTLTTKWTNWQNKMSSNKEAMIQWEHLVKDSHRVIKCANELESKMFPVIPKELNRVESILSFLENRMVVLLPQIKSVQQEMDKFLKKSDVLCPKDKPQPEGQKVVKELQEMNQNFQKKLTDYQILISMMTSYFKNFQELEKIVDMQETQFKMAMLPTDVNKTEALLHEHDACKPTVLELFKFTNTEAEQVIKKINDAEPSDSALQDREKITSIYLTRKAKFETSWDEHRRTLEQHLQMSTFNRDMQQINQQIDDLNSQLSAIKQNYGDSFPSAVATSQAFIQFEKTIEILQIRIQNFVSTAERMMKEQKVDTTYINRELQTMQNKWSTFRTQVSNNRRLIDLSVEYYKLVEESEEWLKEGSRILISIARRSSMCKNVNDANNLHQEIQHFLDKGRLEQEERIKLLSSLSLQLYGNKSHPSIQLVVNKNKDMVDSFSVISSEIKILSENIKRCEVERLKEAKEKEELDAALHAAQAEAEAAKAAAAAARKAAKAAEASVKAVPVQKEEVKLSLTPAKSPMPPVFTVPLKDAEVPEGTKFMFECKVEGYPEPQVQWFKDGILADTYPDYQTKYQDGVCTLTIEETFSEDTATFTCRAMNSSGMAETHGRLVVKESRSTDGLIPPHFIKEPVDATVTEGKSYQFECQVSGNPLPLVSWFKDDVCIDNSTDFSVTYNNGFCTLSLEEASLEHSGRYTCRAINQAGQIACSVSLVVQTSVASERPVFIIPLSNVMARAGQKLRLECSATGQPEPEITWLHNSKSIKETRDIKMQFDGHKATLVITEAFPKDAGVYTVVAKNKAGEAVSTCNVSVKGRLPLETSDSEMASDIEPAKPLVKQNLVDQTVTEGNKVRMDCIIVGQPEPEVIWYHNGKPVKESDDFQLLFEGDRCTLIIKVAYLEDAGTYRCVAINSGGEASSQCQLNVQPSRIVETKSDLPHDEIILPVEKPKPPKFIRLLKDINGTQGQQTKLECQVVGDPVLKIKWFKDGKEISSGRDYEIRTEDTGTTSLIITVTKPFHQGSFSVSAQNEAGEAQCFCSLTVVPPAPKSTAQPTILQTPPSFLKHIEEQRISPGQMIKFEAVVIGVPKPMVQWKFEGKPVIEDKDHQIKADGDEYWLNVFNVSKEHAGRYSVVAENSAGVSTSSALLHVIDPVVVEKTPVVTESLQEQTAQTMIMSKKTIVVEKCTISSMSEVREPETLIQPEQVTPVPSSIPQYSVPVTEAKTILVDTTIEKISVPPSFTKPVPTALITEGEKLFLEGKVEGSPQPECKWFKDNKELHSKPGMNIIHDKGTTSLTVLKSKESDSGMYSCVATNCAGKATSTAEVRVKPLREAPRFKKALQAGVVKSGARITMEIEVTGIPKPEVKWYRNGSLLQSSPDFRISSSGNRHSLIIPEAFPDDSGSLMVVASNAAGEAKSMADLIVEDDRSPEEEKVVSYQETSSIQQKKEMFTKISVKKSATVEPYATAPKLESQTKEPQKVAPKTPSPPPIPAVSAKVWSQIKPEPVTPTIEQPATIEDLPEQYSNEIQLVEQPHPAPTSFRTVAQENVQSTALITSTAPVLSSRSESFVKQTVMKFSEQQAPTKPQIQKVKQPVVKTKQEKPYPIQNGIKQDETSTSLFGSAQTIQQESISETKCQMSYSFVSSQSEVSVSSKQPPTLSQIDSKQPVTSWKPKLPSQEPKHTWKPVQPFSSGTTLASADIVHYQDTTITPVLETKVVSSGPTMNSVYSSKTSVHQSFTTEETTSQKREVSTEQKQIVKGSGVGDNLPKPIIKKDIHSEGPKTKKEVVIEEEPVIGAEVKPPIFSKVRGVESFWKNA